MGLIAGALCALAISLKWKFGFDDSLDVVGVHLVGGVVGSLIIGLLATGARGTPQGLLYGGGLALLGKQAIAVVAVLSYSLVMTLIIGKLIDLTVGFRITEDDEVSGIDLVEHAETAYDLNSISAGSTRPLANAAAKTTGTPNSEKVDA